MGGGSSTTQTQQAQQSVTTPQMPDYASDPTKNYFQGISNYQQQDPYAMVTPANALQTGAFQKANGLFQTGGLYNQAAQGAAGVMNSTPTTYTAGFNGAQTGSLGNASQAAAQGYQAPSLTSAAQVQSPLLGQASTYNPTMAGNASQATATGYNAPNLGNAAQASTTGYNAPQLGPAAQANLQGYQTGPLGPAAQAAGANLGGTANTAQAASLLDNLSAYQNPAQQQLVDATMADFDSQRSRALAEQDARAARGNAFGGSTSSIERAQLESNLLRDRTLANANLNTQAWNAATQLSGQDAANRQQTSLFNANAQNQRDETGASLTAQNNQFNAGQTNTFGLAQFDATNQANQFGASAANTGALANQQALNAQNLAQGQLSADAGQFNANAANTSSQFNAGQTNATNLAQGQLAADAAQFGASAGNQASLYNAGANNANALANQNAANQAGQFNSGAQNDFAIRGADLAQQASLFNAGAQNDFATQNANLAANAGQFNADAQNTANLANMQAQNTYGLADFDAQNQNNQFNAGQANQTQQFNAGTLNEAQAQQLNRQLQSSGLLGDLAGQYGQDYRADLGMQADLGNQLFQMESMYNQAPLTQLQNTGNLLNPGYLQAVSGQTVTSQGNGVEQTKKSGGLLNGLLGAASIGARFIPSDRRLKDDIRRIGKTEAGLPIYTYRYKGDSETRFGVIAQDVEAMQPEALGPIWRGFKTVNYAEVR